MFSFVGDTVLDPFLGSGTTSLAARNLGRNSIGFEINPDFLPIIKEKLGMNQKLIFEDAEFEAIRQNSTHNDFKNVIADPANDEYRIENFFDQQPWILERGFGYKRYHSQVKIKQSLLSRSNQGIRPDKFLERNDGFCDILDLKKPDAPLVIKKPNRARASAKLTEAEAQVDTYVNFVKEPRVRDELQRKGIKVLSPKGLVLIGRTPTDVPDEWEDVKDRLSVEILTYDDLVGQMDIIISWIEELLNKSKYQA